MATDWWMAWRWMWESIACAFMKQEVSAGRVSFWWLGYLNVGERWANTLLGPEHWKEPPSDPPVDAWARQRATR